jgi:predicted amidohydrolase YtcJ
MFCDTTPSRLTRPAIGWTIPLLLLTAGCQPSGPWQLVVYNAKIWTGDPACPAANYLTVDRSGRFAEVGTEAGPGDCLEKCRGADTLCIDAGGSRLIPGLMDAHLHLVSGGLQLARINLRDVPDRAAFIAAVDARARATPAGRWILGGRWSTESWPDPTQPTKEWIDPVTPDHPVLLARMDGHGALANSAALRLAGIDRDGPPDPPGGRIDRDPATNEPTGFLRDTAIDLVAARAPDTPAQELDAALRAALQEAHRHGLTCVHSMSSWNDLQVMDRARAAGELTLRVRVYLSVADWTAFLDRARAFPGDDRLHIRGFKQFMDGSLGSRTAYMMEPFADNPHDRRDWRGILRGGVGGGPPGGASGESEDAYMARFRERCARVVAAGFDPAVHAIGDRANYCVLNAYEEVMAGRPAGQRRYRVEHAQHLLPQDIARFARLGVVASMQPYHKADDGRYAESAIGADRCRSSYAFRSLLDAGAPLAFGSDWPVVSLNPFLGIHAAVTGRTLDGRVFMPQESLSVEEALRAYTAGGAWASGEEDRLGRIRRGGLADFVILAEDPLALPPEKLAGVGVRATYVAGRRVWPAGGAPGAASPVALGASRVSPRAVPPAELSR